MLAGSMTMMSMPASLTMTPMKPMTLGRLSSTRGCCPVCGRDVELRQSYNGERFLQSYGCYRCGPTNYVSVSA